MKVSGILSASRYPFVALVAPQGSKMQVVDRFQGIYIYYGHLNENSR